MHDRRSGHVRCLSGGERADEDEVRHDNIGGLAAQFGCHVLGPGRRPAIRQCLNGGPFQYCWCPTVNQAASRRRAVERMDRGLREGDHGCARGRDSGEKPVVNRQPGGSHPRSSEDAYRVAAGHELRDDRGDQGDIAVAVIHRDQDARRSVTRGDRRVHPNAFSHSLQPVLEDGGGQVRDRMQGHHRRGAATRTLPGTEVAHIAGDFHARITPDTAPGAGTSGTPPR